MSEWHHLSAETQSSVAWYLGAGMSVAWAAWLFRVSRSTVYRIKKGGLK